MRQNVSTEASLTGPKFQAETSSLYEVCIQGEEKSRLLKGEGLKYIGHSKNMVLDTTKPSFENHKRLRFHIWFIMAFDYKMRWRLL